MTDWKSILGSSDIFFVSPDVKRGLGLHDQLSGYHIICSYYDPIIPVLRNQNASIFCLEEEGNEETVNNTGKLLENKKVRQFIFSNTKAVPEIIYFKPSSKIDVLLKEFGYLPLGNNFNLNEEYENKISFHNLISGQFSEAVLPATVARLSDLNFKSLENKYGIPFVIQFGHGWAGKTTFFIDSENTFGSLFSKFGNTRVKIMRKVNGITVINNCCIYNDKVLVGPPALQINNFNVLHPNPSTTCGRQWPAETVNPEQLNTIIGLSGQIGNLMMKSGFRGIFGLDFLIEEKTGKVFLSELNARLTASIPFYTRLELSAGKTPLMAYHIASFNGKDIETENGEQLKITGSQLLLRQKFSESRITSLDSFGVYVIKEDGFFKKGNNYYPEKLKAGEFIFSRRQTYNAGDEETARIESKEKVVENGQLADWVKYLLQKPQTG